MEQRPLLAVLELLLLYSHSAYSQASSQLLLPTPAATPGPLTVTTSTTLLPSTMQTSVTHTQTPENHTNRTSATTVRPGQTEIPLPASNEIKPTSTLAPTEELPFFTPLISGLFVTLISVGGAGLLLICLTFTCICVFRAKRKRKHNRKFTLKMRSEPRSSTSVLLEPITSLNKEETDQMPQIVEFNTNALQTSDEPHAIKHATSNEYFIQTNAVPPPVVPIMPPSVPAESEKAPELEEIYDNNPLSPPSDTDESIYDNEIISTGSEDNIYDNDVVLTKSDDEDSEENIYDNDVTDSQNDRLVNSNTVIVNTNAEDVTEKLYYETVDQWVPQISRERKPSDNRPPPIPIKGAGQSDTSPLEDDEGYIDVAPFQQQTPLVENEEIYDN